MRGAIGIHAMSIETQRGHALAEALAALALIAVLGTAIVSIGRMQWGSLSASHAARLQAFRYAAGDRAAAGTAMVAAPLAASGAFLETYGERFTNGEVSSSVARGMRPASFSAPGGAALTAIRRELGVEDRGMVTARAAVTVPLHRHHGDLLVVRRHASILADAGHAGDDRQAQRRVAASRTVWGNTARGSLAAARQASSQLKNIDQGWTRETPDLDWLSPWADVVPLDRLDRTGSWKGRR